MFTILSIDGGGIRGLIPAMVLEALEARLAATGLDPALHRHFDLICGTSTGGIIAAGLTAPHPNDRGQAAFTSRDLVRLYAEEGGSIFGKSWWRRLRSYFRDEIYDAAMLEAKLVERLGDARLKHALTGVMLTAYDIAARRAVFMANTPGEDEEDYAFRDAARATSAAPTFFEPARIQASHKNGTRERTLVDGGVFVNDPVFSAFVEAHKFATVEAPITREDIHVLSLGTGFAMRSYPYEEVRNWGLIDWLKPSKSTPIISVMMHGQASAAAYMAGRLLNDQRDDPRYVRLDAELTPPASDRMDDTSTGNLRALAEVAARVVDSEDGRKGLDRVVDWLRWRARERDEGPQVS